jgi:hypothetical protein
VTVDLLILVPTRGRPANAAALYRAWRDTTSGASDLLFAVDDDDPALGAYRAVFADMPEARVVEGPRLRLVGTLNAVAVEQAPHYRFLAFMGDDHRPRTAGWDARFVECLSGGTGVVYGNDLLQGAEMPTAVAMTSDIVQALGYFAPNQMEHLCVDLVWKRWAEAIDRITYLDDVIIEHLHPAAGKAPQDQGYEEANNAGQIARDTEAYNTYMAGPFHADVEKLRALL